MQYFFKNFFMVMLHIWNEIEAGWVGGHASSEIGDTKRI